MEKKLTLLELWDVPSATLLASTSDLHEMEAAVSALISGANQGILDDLTLSLEDRAGTVEHAYGPAILDAIRLAATRYASI